MKVTLWVTPKPYGGHDFPEGATPEEARLSPDLSYRVLEIHDNGNMNSEAYFSIVNEYGEVWFISNRYFRVTQAEDENGTPIFLQKDLNYIDSQVYSLL